MRRLKIRAAKRVVVKGITHVGNLPTRSQCRIRSLMAAPVGPISAAQAIGEYLQSPDDLVKIAAFRKKLEKEKASIDTRLKIGVKEQLQATKLGLKKYIGTRDNVQAIKDEMMIVEKECEDPSVRVATFDQISRVSYIFLFQSFF